MSEIGALIVKLQAETAEFRSDMGKVKGDLDDLKDKSGGVGEGMKSSMTEARGGLMLVEESVGVKLPRHLNSLIATIPGVGQAFAMMLPIAGVVVAIEIIGKLIEAHNKAAEAIRKAAEESANAAIKEADQTKALELTNLKLDDQIAKLEHKPSHNYMKEAILETSGEIDRLADTFAADMTRMNDAIASSVGWWAAFKRGAVDALSVGVPLAAGFAAMQKQTLDKLEEKMVEVTTARQKLAEAPMDSASQKTAQQALITALQHQQTELTNSKAAFYGNTEELIKLGTMASSTATEIKDLNLAIDAGSKKKVIAGLEQNKDNLGPLKQEAALWKTITADEVKASEATKAHLDEVAKLAELKTEGDGKDPAKKYEAEHTYNDAVYADAVENADRLEQLAYQQYDKEYKANADDNEKQKQLTASYNAEIASLERSKTAELDSLNQKTLQDWMAAEAKKKQLAVEFSKSEVSLAEATAKLEQSKKLDIIKAEESDNNMKHALGIETERQYIEEKIALTGKERDAKLKAIQDEIDAEKKAAAIAGGAGDLVAQNAALAKKIQLQTQLNTLTTQYGTEIKTLNTDLTKLNSSWSNYFTKMKTETQDLSTQIRTTLQKSVTQFEDSFANSMAKCIVENKSLGAAVRQEAGQMLEAMISMCVKWLENWIITHVMAKLIQTTTDTSGKASAATLAGANMVASWSAAPWPIDAMAPAMGAQAFAAAMAFETGGKIPGEGAVPIVGHGGETVVTKALTDRVESAEKSGGKSGGQHTWNFAPTVHAMDAEGVDRVLTRHSTVFQRHVASTMRRMNK